MSLDGFFTPDDWYRQERQRVSGAGASESLAQAASLRRVHEVATEALRARLPFRWEPGVVRPRYQGPPVWERGPAAVHIWLQEPASLDNGKQTRDAGDWLCSARLDKDTGELRYDPQAAPLYADGTGGPEAQYEQQPSCKNCLRKAEQFKRPRPETVE
jgi:hypothetical protein